MNAVGGSVTIQVEGENMKQSNSLWHRCSGLLLLLGMVVFTGSAAASDYSYSSRFDINTASWSSYRDSLTVDGNCDRYRTVTVNNADTNAPVATDDSCRYGNWQITKSYSSPSAVPCRVKAVQSDGSSRTWTMRRPTVMTAAARHQVAAVVPVSRTRRTSRS